MPFALLTLQTSGHFVLKIYTLTNKPEFLKKALYFAKGFSHFSYFQSNGIDYPYKGFDEMLAFGAKRLVVPASNNRFEELANFHNKKWLFGYMGYDLKNDTEKLTSKNPDFLEFPEVSFFEPEHLILFSDNKIEILSSSEDLFEHILSTEITEKKNSFASPVASVSKQEYLTIINQLRNHIEEGDCYEINFCQEFHGKIEEADPIAAYFELNCISPKPFSCFQKHNQHYILCASPERFIKKNGKVIISQPIKGTRPRGKNSEEDQALVQELKTDKKELAENMMIVDLVRNDLAKSSKTGSIKVEEIFGVYSFEQVHQMISTITSELKDGIHFMLAIKNAFPMGSMTGAPKVKVMELIEEYENTKRGPFSGAAGYISPEGNFDFNVLIRSLFLDLKTMGYSFQVGSAITYDSVPEKEYEECMIKASALLKLLGH